MANLKNKASNKKHPLHDSIVGQNILLIWGQTRIEELTEGNTHGRVCKKCNNSTVETSRLYENIRDMKLQTTALSN